MRANQRLSRAGLARTAVGSIITRSPRCITHCFHKAETLFLGRMMTMQTKLHVNTSSIQLLPFLNRANERTLIVAHSLSSTATLIQRQPTLQ